MMMIMMIEAFSLSFIFTVNHIYVNSLSFCPQIKVRYRKWLCCRATSPCRKIWSWRSWKSSRFFLVFTFFAFCPFAPLQIKGSGVDGVCFITKAQSRQTKAGWRWWDGCGAAGSDGKHARSLLVAPNEPLHVFPFNWENLIKLSSRQRIPLMF